jgi:hypothetical protein
MRNNGSYLEYTKDSKIGILLKKCKEIPRLMRSVYD